MSTYQAEIKCKNCKRINWIPQIPIGTTIEEFCLNKAQECRVCGCDLFIEKKEKEEKKPKKK